VFAEARELLFEGIKTRWEARGAASGAQIGFGGRAGRKAVRGPLWRGGSAAILSRRLLQSASSSSAGLWGLVVLGIKRDLGRLPIGPQRGLAGFDLAFAAPGST
jgi:hypothetical protein